MRPRHDPEIAGELLVGELQRTVEAEGLVGQASEHADRECGCAAAFEQVAPAEFRARALELVGYLCHRLFLLSPRFSNEMRLL